jgi:hypothetical protein
MPAFHVVAQGPVPVPTGQSKINSISSRLCGVPNKTRLAMGMLWQRPGRHASCVMCDEVPGKEEASAIASQWTRVGRQGEASGWATRPPTRPPRMAHPMLKMQPHRGIPT